MDVDHWCGVLNVGADDLEVFEFVGTVLVGGRYDFERKTHDTVWWVSDLRENYSGGGWASHGLKDISVWGS